MSKFYVFNGDADGLCAAQQLARAQAGFGAQVVSGPKRDTGLVDRVAAGRGDEVTVLDVSFDVNRAAVTRLLEAGARVRYFDHHHAGELPSHPGLEAHIDTDPAVCTSVIVDRVLGGAQRRWAIAAAFGDNLDATARALAAGMALVESEVERLRRLGVALNYNSYGECEADLPFAPHLLHGRLAEYDDPLGFVAGDAAFERLWSLFEEDVARAQALEAAAGHERAALYVLPDAGWTRRVNGVFANLLAQRAPARAHAVLVPTSSGGYSVSVRAPLERPRGAQQLCRRFATGGGREGAAGINRLPAEELERFMGEFLAHF